MFGSRVGVAVLALLVALASVAPAVGVAAASGEQSVGVAATGVALVESGVVDESGAAGGGDRVGGADTVGTPTAGVGTTRTAAGEIELAFELRLTPDRPGEIRVRLTATVPDGVTELTLRIPETTTVVSRDGVEPTGTAGEYTWDTETARPTITYRLPANRTGSGAAAGDAFDSDETGVGSTRLAASSGPITFDGSGSLGWSNAVRESNTVGRQRSVGGVSGEPASTGSGDRSNGSLGQSREYLYADPGPWALVELPRWRVGYSYRWSEPSVIDTYSVAGSGAVGRTTAFLGDHRTVTRTAAGQQFRLIVPAAADPVAAPDRVLDALANASDVLRVGDRDEDVLVVVAPTSVDWASAGLSNGDSDVWVRANEPLETADTVWIHEYVHTRQAYRTTNGTRWLDEGMADYYAAKLALRFGLVEFDAFADVLRRGRADRYADAVLADPSTWRNRPQYDVGALVAGELDRRIAVETNGSAAFQTVVDRLNERDQPVTRSSLQSLLTEIGGTTVASDAETYTTTRTRPSVWTRRQHDAAFGTLPASLETVRLAYTVTGPYRNVTSDLPRVVVPGERVEAVVTVTNTGGSSGTYEATLAVGGRVAANATATVGPNETVTVPLAYRVTTGDVNRTVTLNGEPSNTTVRQAATAEVVGLDLRSETVRPGETVGVTVTVANTADRPATRTVRLRVDGSVVGRAVVRLGPGARTTVTFDVTLDDAGEYTVAVGDRETTVSVVSPTPSATTVESGTATPPDESPTDGGSSGGSSDETRGAAPGFEVGLAVAALVAAGLLARRRR